MRNARILLPVFILIVIVNLATKSELLGRLIYLIAALLLLGALWAWLNLRNVQIVRQTRARRIFRRPWQQARARARALVRS